MLPEFWIVIFIATVAAGYLVYRVGGAVWREYEVRPKKAKPEDAAAIKQFDTDERKIIRHVRSERKKAQSIARNAFVGISGIMFILTSIVIAFVGLFYFLDWRYAGLKSFGKLESQIIYFTIFAILDSLMLVMMIVKVIMGWSWRESFGIATMILIVTGSIMNLFVTQGSTGQSAIADTTTGDVVVTETQNARADIKAGRERLVVLRKSTKRSPDVIRSEIVPENVIASTARAKQAIWNRTRERKNGLRVGMGCKDVTRPDSQAACKKITAFRRELKEALERDDLAKSLPKMEAALSNDPRTLQTDYDVMATTIKGLFARYGVKKNKQDVSVGITQFMALIMAVAFTLTCVIYPYVLKYSINDSERDRREETDIMLASIGYIEDENGHIRPVRPEEAKTHYEAVNGAISKELTGIKDQLAHAKGGDTHIHGVDLNSVDIVRVEQFLLRTADEDIQKSYKTWKSEGNSESLSWFANNARMAALKPNGISVDGSAISRAA